MHSLVIFASGQGTNAAAIIDYFKGSSLTRVTRIVSNKADAGVLKIAEKEGIPATIINKESFQGSEFIDSIMDLKPDLLILAGFLWKVPDNIIRQFRNRIINIHPALLPAHGGKGMYGHHVHKAVLESGKNQSGITIHYVDEVYDNGDIILQAHCPVSSRDTADDLAARIHKLEHYYFPRTIEFILKNSPEAASQGNIQ
jgi:phosphoribosylglycinamide formyltransferase 1